MFSMYRAMADLGNTLTLSDVKATTLWFRTFSKFLGQYVFRWHQQDLFPWVYERLQLEPSRSSEIEKLCAQREEVASFAKTVYAKYARVSAEVSDDSAEDVDQSQFVEAAIASVKLAERLVQYFRDVESFVAPSLKKSGVTPEDRDKQFSMIVEHMQANRTVRMDLPILVRWMTRSNLKDWLVRCAVDHRGRTISFSSFNRWQRDYFGEGHLKIVQDVMEKSRMLSTD